MKKYPNGSNFIFGQLCSNFDTIPLHAGYCFCFINRNGKRKRTVSGALIEENVLDVNKEEQTPMEEGDCGNFTVKY